MNQELYDNALSEIEHYKRMPQMLPWVGENYGKEFKKVLFVGESHYFPKGSTLHLNSDDWYKLEKVKLSWDEVFYTTTREALLINYKRNQIWRDTAFIMNKAGITYFDENKNMFDHFAFYNFFQRPAQEEGDQLYIDENDIVEANTLFLKIIDVIKPQVVIFLSSKAWNSCNKKNISDIYFDFTAHPSSIWWNRKAKKYSFGNNNQPLTGCKKFEIIIKNKVL